MLTIDLSGAFSLLWSAFLSVVDWLQNHGIRVVIGETAYVVNFFVIAIAVAVLRIVLGLVPIFDPYDPDEDMLREYWGDDLE